MTNPMPLIHIALIRDKEKKENKIKITQFNFVFCQHSTNFIIKKIPGSAVHGQSASYMQEAGQIAISMQRGPQAMTSKYMMCYCLKVPQPAEGHYEYRVAES